MNHFWQVSGIIFWCVLGISIILRLIYGKNWLLKIGANTFFGAGLIGSIKTLIQESKQRDIKEETVAKVGAHIIWRLTRVGIFALLFALIPFVLLFQQNQLIGKQNELITFQNKRIDKQTELDSLQTIKLQNQNDLFQNQNNLFADQNIKVTKQTDLLEDQNRLFGTQNLLVRSQNTRVDSQLVLMKTQNDRVKIQNNLIEADRRSSLVFLMSNILDKVDEEIKEQSKNSDFRIDIDQYNLSDPLVARIVALSRAFKPYQILQADTLSSLVSPERGQLFIALMENNLDSITQNTIISKGDFSNANIEKITLDFANLCEAKLDGANLYDAKIVWGNLKGAYFSNAYLKHANFRSSNFEGADFSYANLEYVNFSQTNLLDTDFDQANLRYANFRSAHLIDAQLYGADLQKAFFRDASLREVNFDRVLNLKIGQLREAKSLYKSKNLPPKIEAQLRKEKPCLFTEKGCELYYKY